MNTAAVQKIVARDVLRTIVCDLKQEGATIVTTNGSFDVLHIGHVTMLQEAKSLGDVLIVGLNSDASVRRYKGKARPICPQEHRARMLAALSCTDYITIFDELTPIPLLEVIQPHIHVNSPEHGRDCIERDVVERHGGRIHLAHLIEGMSTSQLLARIREAIAAQPRQGIFLNPADLLAAAPEDLREMFIRFRRMNVSLFLFEHADAASMAQVLERFQQYAIEYAEVPHISETTWQIEQIADAYDLSLAKSVLISSAMQDIRFGRELNCKTILIRPPSHTENPHQGESYIGPHYTVADLKEAVGCVGEMA